MEKQKKHLIRATATAGALGAKSNSNNRRAELAKEKQKKHLIRATTGALGARPLA